MKKILLFAAVAVMVLTTASCQKGYKAELKNDVDSISYDFGVGTGSQLKSTMQRQDIDTTYIDEVIDGIRDGIKIQGNKKKEAYALGMMIGLQSAGQLNEDIFMGSKEDKLSTMNFMAGIVDGSKHNFKMFDPQKQRQDFQNKVMAIQAKISKKIKKENEAYLKEYAKDKSVKKLPSGVMYKVLKEGKGKVANDNSEVTFRYEGRTIDGKIFDSNMNEDPVTMNPAPGQLIPGFTEVLKKMPVGSKWEVCIPQDQAYGEQGAPGGNIKPFSTLIFTIEVINVEDIPNVQSAQPTTQSPAQVNGIPVNPKQIQEANQSQQPQAKGTK